MLLKTIPILFLLLSLGLNCKSCDNKINSNPDSLAIKTAKEFYNWYIHDVYSKSTGYYQVPTFKKLNETTYIFDLAEFKGRINTIEYFTKDYKKKLVSKLKSCNAEMRKVKWDYEPEPMFNIVACNYLWGNQWVGGQGEKITGFKIESAQSDSDDFLVIVEILTRDKVFVRSHVLLKKTGKEFKINDINLVWN
jgi:hypothetical protein